MDDLIRIWTTSCNDYTEYSRVNIGILHLLQPLVQPLYLVEMQVAVVSVLILLVQCLRLSSVQGGDYGVRLQPELDAIDVDSYLANERLFNLQMSCVLFDGPCDAVGRWLKPRIASGLQGSCLMCTPKQEKDMAKILAFISANRPDLYRTALTKYAQASGVQVPADEAKKVESLRSLVNGDLARA